MFDSNLTDLEKFTTISPLINLIKEYKKWCGVDDILGFNDNRRWYRILGFNDYEISNDNFVRSNRRWHQYPYGVLLEPFKYDKDGIAYYMMSDNKDKNHILHISQIQFLKEKANQEKYGHPFYTEVTHYYGADRGAYIKQSFDSNEEFLEYKRNLVKEPYRFNECPIKIIKKIEVE